MVEILPSDPPSANWKPPAWWRDLEAGQPVVTVTQGTLANTDFTQLIAPTLEALADHDVLVIATLGREVDAFPQPVPPNARIERFIPYSALLPHTSVYVTNGGFGGTQQAIAVGVPVVVAGDTDDKPLVAVRVAYRGAGYDLGTARPSPKQLETAILDLLTNTAIQSTASRLSEQYAQHDAIAAIDALVRGD
jgi:UDP:flavonoid glycosyltransferase YjiC (YdhE family)